MGCRIPATGKKKLIRVRQLFGDEIAGGGWRSFQALRKMARTMRKEVAELARMTEGACRKMP
jgi:hypothetical protein